MIIGVTGGIGSGKSALVRTMSSLFGCCVYDTDSAAKRIITEDKQVKQRVESLLGSDVFDGDTYLTPVAARRLFADTHRLEQMNAIVHPAVAEDIRSKRCSMLIVETALLFTTPAISRICDITIAVIAPLELRIARAMARDNVCREQIEARIAKQLSDEEMAQRADIIITNDGSQSLQELATTAYKQINNILGKL